MKLEIEITEENKQLKPCPFCGTKPEKKKKGLGDQYGYADQVTYLCPKCGCSQSARGITSGYGYADNSTVEKRALTAWQTRELNIPTGMELMMRCAPTVGEVIAKTVAREREACAKVCETVTTETIPNGSEDYNTGWEMGATVCSNKIRMRHND